MHLQSFAIPCITSSDTLLKDLTWVKQPEKVWRSSTHDCMHTSRENLHFVWRTARYNIVYQHSFFLVRCWSFAAPSLMYPQVLQKIKISIFASLRWSSYDCSLPRHFAVQLVLSDDRNTLTTIWNITNLTRQVFTHKISETEALCISKVLYKFCFTCCIWFERFLSLFWSTMQHFVSAVTEMQAMSSHKPCFYASQEYICTHLHVRQLDRHIWLSLSVKYCL